MSRIRLATGAVTALGIFAVGWVGTFEGRRNNAYLDIVKVATICFGETQGVKLGQTKTDAECADMLVRRLVEFEASVMECGRPDMPEGVHVAHVSLAYNIGKGAYCSSTTARRARAKDWRGSCVALTWFNKAGGKVVGGLVTRRAKERAVCDNGIPANYVRPAWLVDYAKGGPTPTNDNVVKPNPNFKRRVQHPADSVEAIKENPPPLAPPLVRVPPVEKCILFWCWKVAA